MFLKPADVNTVAGTTEGIEAEMFYHIFLQFLDLLLDPYVLGNAAIYSWLL